jgi:HK97 family phage portal protein
MEKVKTITNVPGWAETFTTGGQAHNSAGSYAAVPLVYRCVRLISDALSSVPVVVRKGEAKVSLPFEFDISEWVWRTTASLLLTGASYSVKLKSKSGRVLGLQWLNPTTVSINLVSGQPVFSRTGNVQSGQAARWTLDDMLYIREFSLKDDYLPGVSAAEVALTDSGLIRYLTRFASYYFEQGAQPLTILSVDKQILQGEADKLQGFFKSTGTGIRNAWRTLVLRGGKEMAPFTITPNLETMAMPALYDQARRAVAGAFGIPQTMLEDAANYATAKEHRLSFWQDTIRPRGQQIMSALNAQLLEVFGLEAEFAFDEMDIFQEDEASRAGSLLALTNAGVPLVVAMDILGYDIEPEHQGLILAASGQPAVVETAPETQPEMPAVSEMPGQMQPGNGAEVRSAMYHWKQAALAAVKSGHEAGVEFDHPVIPEAVSEYLRSALVGVMRADQVHAAFKQARELLKQQPVKAVVDGGIDATAELKRASDLLEMVLHAD